MMVEEIHGNLEWEDRVMSGWSDYGAADLARIVTDWISDSVADEVHQVWYIFKLLLVAVGLRAKHEGWFEVILYID